MVNGRRIVVLHLRSSSGSGGGPEKTIRKTGAMIDRGRFEYLVAYLRRPGGMLGPVADGLAASGVEYHEIAAGRLDLAALRRVAALIRERRVDILHCHDYKTDLYGALLGLACPRVRRATTLHGWIENTSWKSRPYTELDRFSLRWFDLVIAVSEEVRRQARRHTRGDVRLLHNAIDTAEWDPDAPLPDRLDLPARPGACVVGYSGRISREKGSLEFVRVARRLLDQDAGFDFVVAGEGPLREEMRGLARDLGIEGRMHFIGQVNSRRMPSFYRQVHILLSPSQSEGLPNNLLEACAMEVPIVATAVGGVGELVQDGGNGLLCQAGDIDGLARAVLKLRQSPDLARSLARRARVVVQEQFSFERRVRRLEEWYDELARRT